MDFFRKKKKSIRWCLRHNFRSLNHNLKLVCTMGFGVKLNHQIMAQTSDMIFCIFFSCDQIGMPTIIVGELVSDTLCIWCDQPLLSSVVHQSILHELHYSAFICILTYNNRYLLPPDLSCSSLSYSSTWSILSYPIFHIICQFQTFQLFPINSCKDLWSLIQISCCKSWVGPVSPIMVCLEPVAALLCI